MLRNAALKDRSGQHDARSPKYNNMNNFDKKLNLSYKRQFPKPRPVTLVVTALATSMIISVTASTDATVVEVLMIVVVVVGDMSKHWIVERSIK